MRKIYLSLFLALLVIGAKAQVNYTFAASSGTYSAISGTSPTLTTTTADGGSGVDEAYASGIPIGFSFNYNGTSYTTVGVCTNGFLYFGSGTPTNNIYVNNLTSGQTAIRPIVAPFWSDLDFSGPTSIQYTTTGSAGSRVFTMQWYNAKWDYQATSGSISFQAKFFEGTNVIQFIYQQEAGAISGDGVASIGLTAAGTGSGSFISLESTGASPTTSTTTEEDALDTRPASGQIYAFTPVAGAANDATVSTVYGLGKTARSFPTVFTAIVKNFGSNPQTNLNVTLNITGANTFTNMKTIASLAPGASTTVTFDAFQSGVAGTNNISVSVPSDDNNGNNSSTTTQTVTTNSVGTSNNTTATLGVGSNTGPLEFGTKFTNTGTKTIDQVTLYFPTTSTGQPYLVVIYDATGAGGAPGTALFTSTSQTTGGANVNLPVSPAVTVSGDFYVAIKQTGSTNMGYGYEVESPLKPNTYFINNSGTWVDMASVPYTFKLMMDARFSSGLPVTISSFTGEAQGKANLLKWTTSTESNNKGFELQRSADGRNFSTIGFVATKADNGNSSVDVNYTYTDNSPLAGGNYYRLKQVDKDGKFNYSAVVLIKSKNSSMSISSVYPNPARNEVNLVISTPAAERITVIVTDLSGKTIMKQVYALVSGDNQQTLNIQNLAPGNYLIKAICDNGCETTVQRFVKQ